MTYFKFRRDYYGYLFIAPFVIAFLIFGLYPVYNTLYLSLTDTTLMSGQSNFVGLKNFKDLFANNVFMTAVRNTWLIWILNFIPQIGIAMLLSVWFTSTTLRLKNVGTWRAIYFLPNLLMPAAVAALFASLFSFYGPMNQLMVRSGLLPEAKQWLSDPAIARGLVVFIQWWMW
ncbi:MAG: sugar ABC transporter permease, partial [Caldilineaceae bacterium]|nr:sugar ABC transporter permease [Caldilineaceae bacterium]